MRPSGSGESALLLLDVVELLDAQKVGYAVIGALAASVHGAVRASLDADLVLSVGMREATNLDLLYRAAGLRTQFTQGDFDDPIPALLVVSDSFGNRVDLLIGMRGLEPQAFARVVRVPFQGSTLKFIGREDFIAMKVFAGGPIDVVDATRAIAAGGESLDLQLVRRLAKRFGRDAAELMERVLAAGPPPGTPSAAPPPRVD
jgi:predicted nucleotidyltransferase